MYMYILFVQLVEISTQHYDVIVSRHCSQSLSTLSYIEKLLGQRSIPIPNSTNPSGAVQYSSLKWTKNKNYCSKFGIVNLLNFFND